MKKLLLTIGVGILTAVCQAEIIKTSLGDIVLSDSGASKAAEEFEISFGPFGLALVEYKL